MQPAMIDNRYSNDALQTMTPDTHPAPSWPLGSGRPALAVHDLPTPEEAFRLRRIGVEEKLLLALGPGVIALGMSIGSGEWLLAPLTVARYGFTGILWIVLVSILLQVFYNVELARYTLATGEPPVVGFGRVPPGYWLWVPLALFSFFAAFILGGWTVSAGATLYVIATGSPSIPEQIEQIRMLGIGLLVAAFIVLLVGRRIERTMAAVQGIFLPYLLLGMFMVTVVVVPFTYWRDATLATLLPARPPQGTDISLLGALAGFAALASGLNFMFIGYYRDRGYGMGSRVGYLSGLIGGEPGALSHLGQTFPENQANAAVWKRWFRILLFDQWGIYFVGAFLGIFLPVLLSGYLAASSNTPLPDQSSVQYYIAYELGRRYGQLAAGWAYLMGFVILFSTQIAILELLARNLTDALYSGSASFRAWARHDPRRFYYPAMLGIILLISLFIHIALPVQLTVISGNLSNFAALIFPLLLIYLNRRLPRPARIGTWSTLVLIANTVFFGFFFINFLASQIFGVPLLRF